MGFPSSSVLKTPLSVQETRETQEKQERSLGPKDPLKEGTATRSSILAMKTP